MASVKEAVRRQRRRELDARRGKSRIRLGSCLENWEKLRKTLGFSLQSEFAQYLLDTYFSKVCSRCSGDGNAQPQTVLSTTAASLQQLILLVHSHSQHCSLPPNLQLERDPKTFIQADPKASVQGDSSVLRQAGTKDVAQACPTGITQACLTCVAQAGPTGCKQPVLKLPLHADPMQAGPEGFMHGEPKSCIKAGPIGIMQVGPKGSIEASLKSSLQTDPKSLIQTDPEGSIQADPKDSIQAAPKDIIQTDTKKSAPTEASLQAQMCLKYTCEAGHVFMWCLMQTVLEVDDPDEGEGEDVEEQEEEATKSVRKRGRREAKEGRMGCANQEVASGMRMRSGRGAFKSVEAEKTKESKEKEVLGGDVPDCSGEDEEPDAEESEEHICLQEGSDAVTADVSPSTPPGSNEINTENTEDESQSPVDREKKQSAVPNPTKRERQRREDPHETKKADNMRPVRRKRTNRPPFVKDDVSQICGKRKRKATPKLILPCEFNGCWKIFSSRQYLNHHMKYQHVQQKTFICSHPSCGKSFNFKKHLKEHEKLHSDQRDYICEFCARAFRTSSNLSIHRRIHTGEKPLQCEVCGYTCRQKASLNWHMRKHDAESSYQFPCEICGRRFEKRDNVVAHQSKSHPEHLPTSMDTPSLKPTQDDPDAMKPKSPTSTEHNL